MGITEEFVSLGTCFFMLQVGLVDAAPKNKCSLSEVHPRSGLMVLKGCKQARFGGCCVTATVIQYPG
jgi:hypothetical protein